MRKHNIIVPPGFSLIFRNEFNRIDYSEEICWYCGEKIEELNYNYPIRVQGELYARFRHYYQNIAIPRCKKCYGIHELREQLRGAEYNPKSETFFFLIILTCISSLGLLISIIFWRPIDYYIIFFWSCFSILSWSFFLKSYLGPYQAWRKEKKNQLYNAEQLHPNCKPYLYCNEHPLIVFIKKGWKEIKHGFLDFGAFIQIQRADCRCSLSTPDKVILPQEKVYTKKYA